MMTVAFREGEPGTRGSWWKWKERIILCCPACGTSSVLTDHSVTDEGEVNPAVRCEGCDFFGLIRLEGYVRLSE